MENSLVLVPFYSFQDAPVDLIQSWRAAIDLVIKKGVFIGGEEVEAFQSEWSVFLKTTNCVGVGNGFDAIFLALKALGIQKGMKVAVPIHTYIATWLAIAHIGAEPIGIDCGENGLMDLNELENLNVSIDCVVAVHMHGQMVDMPRLTIWAKSRGIKVVEDCAQAHGAQLNGKFAGTWGDVGAFSFYPNKNLGAIGDAGAIVTMNQEIAETVRSYGNYGTLSGDKYNFKLLGVNSRMDPLQAAILRVNLQKLSEWNENRRSKAISYYTFLNENGISHLNVDPKKSVHHHCILFAHDRDNLRKELQSLGVSTEIHYPKTAEENFYQATSREFKSESRAKKLSRMTLSLPLSPWLSDVKIEYVKECLVKPKILKLITG
jgi:dTDP-4-amino-4,6-dideoxygalactose transaminase